MEQRNYCGKARVTFDFNADGETEISLRTGQIVQLISAPPDDEWWQGRLYIIAKTRSLVLSKIVCGL